MEGEGEGYEGKEEEERIEEQEESWEEEKRMLVKMAANSKELARVATEKLRAEEERIQGLLRQKELSYRTEVEALKIENKMLKFERAQWLPATDDRDKFFNNLRTQLIEEIERLERLHKQKEDEMFLDNSNLKIEIDTLKQSLGEAKKKEYEFEATSKKQIHDMKAEYEKSHRTLCDDLKAQKVRADSYLYRLNDARGEIQAHELRAREFNREKMQEAIGKCREECERDKQKLGSKMRQVEELSDGRLAERDSMLKALEKQLTDETAAVEKKYRVSINEKKAIEAQLKGVVESHREKEEVLKRESGEVRDAIHTMVARGTEKEQNVRQLVAKMTQEYCVLQQVFQEREEELMEDIKKVAQERKNVEAVIEKVQGEVSGVVSKPEHVTLYEAQKKELELTIKKLDEKTKELLMKKEKEIAGFNGTRKTITAAIESIQEFIKRSRTTEQKLKEEFKQLSLALANTNDMHNKEEESSALQIAQLSEELKKLRLDIRNRDALRLEEKVASLEGAYLKAQTELEGSKKILMAHIDTINALEDRIKLRGESEHFDKDDELVRVKMENIRLNAENAALLSGKQKMETHYTSEIEQLNEKYLKKRDDYDSLLNKYNNLHETSVAKKLDEMKAWKKRSDNLRKTISSLEEKMEDLAAKNLELLKFQTQQGELKEEELTLLRSEVKRSDSFWLSKKAEWDGDRKELEEELRQVREKSKLVESSYGQMKALAQEKASVLQDSIAQAKMVEMTYRKTMEALSKSNKEVLEWVRREQEAEGEQERRGLEEMSDKMARLTEVIEGLKQQHAKEVQMITQSLSGKIGIVKEKEENALLELEKYRAQIDVFRRDIEVLRELNQKEAELKSEPSKQREERRAPATARLAVNEEKPVQRAPATEKKKPETSKKAKVIEAKLTKATRKP